MGRLWPIAGSSAVAVALAAWFGLSAIALSPSPSQVAEEQAAGGDARPGVRVAFVRDRDIYLLDAAAGTETRLTDDSRNHNPWWTTDGQTLFFEKWEGGQRQTWRWRPDTGARAVQIGLWSPDGTAVAFQEPAPDSQQEIVTWVERGGQRARVTPAEAGIRWQPLAWSRDGRRLALARLQPPPPGVKGEGGVIPPTAATLWITDGDVLAGQLRQLPMPPSFGGETGMPDIVIWSPDGRFLTIGVGPAAPCSSCRADGLPFHAVPVDGGPSVALDSALVPTGAPSWTPNGSFVVLSIPGGRETYHNKRVVRFDPVTGAQIRLADDPRYADIEPSISPDGQQIAFARGWAQIDGRPQGPIASDLHPNVATIASRRLWLMPADGANPRQILSAPGWADEAPRWTPDGRWIVFVRWQPPRPDQPAAVELWAVQPDGSNAQRLVTGLGQPLGFYDGLGFYGSFGWQALFALAP